MKHLKILYGVFYLLTTHLLQAQDGNTLSPAQLVEIVKKYHPIARQADNKVQQAEADITTAKASFDPVLQGYTAQKVFEGKDYYHYAQPEVKIPTWYGMEIYAGAEYVSGSRTNPEKTVGKTSYAGISVPLLKNLLMDKKRAALQQAKIVQQQTEAEKLAAINDLLQQALNSYWAWVQQHQLSTLVDQLITINEKRFELVKTSYLLGERPAIDTVEAEGQLQAFLNMQQDVRLATQNAVLDLSYYLWQQENEPYLLPETIKPDTANNLKGFLKSSAEQLVNIAKESHPELQQYKYKLDYLVVDRKAKFQELLPQLNIKYNQLGNNYNFLKNNYNQFFENNYRYGVTFSMPLRLSQGRGEYRKAKLKIVHMQLEVSQKLLSIENKIRASYNKVKTLEQQLVIQQQMLNNYRALQKAEELKYASGESSLFLINSRENKTLEAQQKLIETKAKYAQAYISLLWASGTLHNAAIQ